MDPRFSNPTPLYSFYIYSGHRCQNYEDLTMKYEVKYIFPTSTPGLNNYIYKLPDGLGMRRIVAHGTRIQKNPQTREDIFWIFADFHRVMWVQSPT